MSDLIESKTCVNVRAKSTIKLLTEYGCHVDLSIESGDDLICGVNTALSFAGIKKKVILVDTE